MLHYSVTKTLTCTTSSAHAHISTFNCTCTPTLTHLKSRFAVVYRPDGLLYHCITYHSRLPARDKLEISLEIEKLSSLYCNTHYLPIKSQLQHTLQSVAVSQHTDHERHAVFLAAGCRVPCQLPCASITAWISAMAALRSATGMPLTACVAPKIGLAWRQSELNK